MFEPRRQHPVAAITQVLSTLREFLIPLIVVAVAGGRAENPTVMLTIGGLMLVGMFIWGVLSWMRFTFYVENGDLNIQYGVLERNKVQIPRDRIQVIDISSGVIQRLFGLVKVQVQTAGQSSGDTEISALTREEAEELRRLLRNGEQTGEQRETREQLKHHWRLSPGMLLMAATTSGSLGVALSVIGTLMSQINQILPDQMVYEYLERVDMPSGQLVTYMIIGMVVAAWLLALFGTLFRFAGFSLSVKQQELVIQRGLFERKQMTIPYRRIQAIRIVEGILRQPFGYATLYVESAGYGDEGGTSSVLFPLVHRDQVREMLARAVPEYLVESPSVRPPARALLRYMIKTMIPAVLVVVPVTWLLDYGYLSLVLLPLTAVLGWLRYRDAAAGHVADHLVLRFRVLARTTALIRRKRLQALELQSNLFQRRRDLVSLSVTVASGTGGYEGTVHELSEPWGRYFLSWSSPAIRPKGRIAVGDADPGGAAAGSAGKRPAGSDETENEGAVEEAAGKDINLRDPAPKGPLIPELPGGERS